MRLSDLADGIAEILQRHPLESKQCRQCADELSALLRSAGIECHVARVTHALWGRYFHTQDGRCFAETGVHFTVRVDDTVIDSLTGREGVAIADYHKLWRDVESNELEFDEL